MSVHRRIADLIPSHGEGQLMTHKRYSRKVSAKRAMFVAGLAKAIERDEPRFSSNDIRNPVDDRTAGGELVGHTFVPEMKVRLSSDVPLVRVGFAFPVDPSFH